MGFEACRQFQEVFRRLEYCSRGLIGFSEEFEDAFVDFM